MLEDRLNLVEGGEGHYIWHFAIFNNALEVLGL